MKRCFKCKAYKPLFAFYVHKEMGDGHLGKCKACAKKDVKAHYRDPRFHEKVRAYDRARNRDPERLHWKHERQKRIRALFPGKYRARHLTGVAVKRGTLKRMPCEVCGDTKVQAHHPDYRKPLFVKWLCFKHHRMEHGQLKVAA